MLSPSAGNLFFHLITNCFITVIFHQEDLFFSLWSIGCYNYFFASILGRMRNQLIQSSILRILANQSVYGLYVHIRYLRLHYHVSFPWSFIACHLLCTTSETEPGREFGIYFLCNWGSDELFMNSRSFVLFWSSASSKSDKSLFSISPYFCTCLLWFLFR